MSQLFSNLSCLHLMFKVDPVGDTIIKLPFSSAVAILPLIITINKQSVCEWMGSLPPTLKHSSGNMIYWDALTQVGGDAFFASQSMQIENFNQAPKKGWKITVDKRRGERQKWVGGPAVM
uniref:Uncharacterized protein n=1 Tax=Seriola lalandi dorsalis TaxID=1841481 RepID=A0A3B4Y985_SERLL